MSGVASKTKTVTINGVPYTIMPHPARECLKLGRLIASHFQSTGLSGLKVSLDSDVSALATWGGLAAAFCEYSVEHDPEFTLIGEFFKHTQVTLNGKQTYVMNVFDDHFAANWMELVELVKEVASANRFLPALSNTGSPSET